MTNLLPILVAYNGSEAADHGLAWAADEAAGSGAPIRVVMIDEVFTSPRGGDIRVPDPEVLLRAEKLLQDRPVDFTTERHGGHVVGDLLRMAESASMLVVGSRGHGRVGETLVGSVSQHLARHATCPVIVVRPALAPHAARIVVGVDGSSTSKAALEFACDHAKRAGAEVVAIHGWTVHTPSTDVWNSAPRTIDDDTERERLLRESVADVRAAHPDIELLEEAIPVAPGQALVDASANASLVVVGSRGRGFFSGLLLGSVSQDVVQHARCSVAVVR